MASEAQGREQAVVKPAGALEDPRLGQQDEDKSLSCARHDSKQFTYKTLSLPPQRVEVGCVIIFILQIENREAQNEKGSVSCSIKVTKRFCNLLKVTQQVGYELKHELLSSSQQSY